MKREVLIIDDDKKLNALLTDYFEKFNFRARSVVDPEEALRLLSLELPDIIILDIMLPKMDGFQVLKKIRQKYPVPVIMLTAREEVSDRVMGLELGADDYLPKPFEPRELVARMESVLRRASHNHPNETITIGRLTIDNNTRTASLNGKDLLLTSLEYSLLNLFVMHPGRVFSRDHIMANMRGEDWSAFDRSIDVLLSRLRQKLGDDPKNPQFIKTIWGSGYMFISNNSKV
ncbi:MAG: response regulator transcription factor [Spirochaetales bacterium]|nr:response regulator transcription factor [Spirochaetales bacterium]